MKMIIAAAGLWLIPMFGMVSTGDGNQHEVSRSQYEVLIGQCRYGNTAQTRQRCRAAVRANYRIGSSPSHTLDCRTYSSVTVCGTLHLTPNERRCVRDSVSKHLSYRRAEVECYAFQ
jgi:hypothetical protein